MFQWVLAIIACNDITQQHIQKPEMKHCERILQLAKKFQIVLVTTLISVYTNIESMIHSSLFYYFFSFLVCIKASTSIFIRVCHHNLK